MVVSIFKFLLRYYGIPLDAGLKCSHRDLKESFPFLERYSYEYADSNPDLVYSGEIIYVVDSYNNIVPYKCPDEFVMASNECGFSVVEKNNDEELEYYFIIEHLHDIPTYELGELMHKYKNKHCLYRKIKRELMARGVYQNKKHKLNKEINRMEIEESDFNDKYKRRRKIKYNKS